MDLRTDFRKEAVRSVSIGHLRRKVVHTVLKFLSVAVLDGEVAVPCTRNPLQRGRIPARGFVSVEPAPSK